MSNPRTSWSPDHWERAKRLRKGGMSFRHIAEALHVNEDRVKMKFSNEGAKGRAELGIPRGYAKGPPAEVLIERDRACDPTLTLTARLCGDPAPGRSALDKKNMGPAR